jgi:hypothetical protein
MRQTFIAAAAAFVMGGIALGAVLSQAQPVPPPAQQLEEGAPPQQGGHWAGGWGHHRGPEEAHWRHHGLGRGPFALIYRQKDRQLAPADVQKIVEGFLLWNGNHTWKVADVAATAEGPISFSLATQEGSVIAKFTMDPHTGRIKRIG